MILINVYLHRKSPLLSPSSRFGTFPWAHFELRFLLVMLLERSLTVIVSFHWNSTFRCIWIMFLIRLNSKPESSYIGHQRHQISNCFKRPTLRLFRQSAKLQMNSSSCNHLNCSKISGLWNVKSIWCRLWMYFQLTYHEPFGILNGCNHINIFTRSIYSEVKCVQYLDFDTHTAFSGPIVHESQM